MTAPITTYEQAQEALKPLGAWLHETDGAPAAAVLVRLDDGTFLRAWLAIVSPPEDTCDLPMSRPAGAFSTT